MKLDIVYQKEYLDWTVIDKNSETFEVHQYYTLQT